ncbi:M1 family metallopeptidase [Siansivirga zeaxanthinifaciens]|uniref:Peptidase M1 n=1 Tax=Siansivirga zeaxanthinifaciens CC-SAMT-1 TaxID=1454006 RepID=A0A0C5WC55_9FLAO|nr:M1 family metallopeptidase [Siansivirga zeaxanthinifaciens]AJR02929.1 peptidase M1 [Siansivirga zeaxanthinifaciens CC-SAMT-1]
MKRLFVSVFSLLVLWSCYAYKPNSSKHYQASIQPPVTNPTYWQQHVDYTMDIDMNVNNYQYKGTQKLVYTNNSPDVLTHVYYHLYFNAFQPGSEMDVRSLTIADPDPRVGDRISKLNPDEIGYIKVKSLKQNGKKLKYETAGTVLEVDLAKPIQPGERVTFEMEFDGQVPIQIRRSGRNNKEGVALSMTQWYPKLAEYDFEGWHADPYIGREFHGVWGDFDVTLHIDRNYIVGGTGYLQNPNEVGFGYETGTVNKPKSDKLTWHFKAPNVHDFTWAADPDYIHDTMQVPDGPTLHFLYKSTLDAQKLENWKKMQPKTVELMQYYSKNVGKYPYDQYSVIQGGDGGMEYAMCTLITGNRSYGSLVGVTAHEMAHTWFQFLLASNEARHEWMDEGFTSYISDWAMNDIMNENNPNPTASAYKGYIYLAKSGKEQPLTTHADRYQYNQAYSISAYSKGEVFLAQLGYIIGDENLKQTLKTYFNEWAFKHPTPNSIIRCAEKVSDLELEWYLVDFAQTTNTIDYGVKSIEDKTVTLERIGLMPMPIDLTVTYTDGSTEDFYIPLQMMRGEKPTKATQIKDWAWAYPTYTFTTKKSVKNVQIDPKELMADINKENNSK